MVLKMKSYFSRIGSRSSSLLDVNAREFYPGAGISPPQQPTLSPLAAANAMDDTLQVRHLALEQFTARLLIPTQSIAKHCSSQTALSFSRFSEAQIFGDE